MRTKNVEGYPTEKYINTVSVADALSVPITCCPEARLLEKRHDAAAEAEAEAEVRHEMR
jgi:hypothetical protein